MRVQDNERLAGELARRGGGSSLEGPGRLLRHWEWRARQRLDADGCDTVEDGGLRFERLDPATGRVSRWCFLVGAEPSDDPLAPPRAPAGRAWARDVFRRRFEELTAAADGLLESIRASLGDRAGAVELSRTAWARWRAWSYDEGAAEVRFEPGVVIQAVDRETRWRGEWACGDPSIGPPRIEGGRVPRRVEPVTTLDDAAASGSIILLPSAAAWLVHEMAHAAFEAVEPIDVAGPRGLSIVERPALAPPPAGFGTDDLGWPAGQTVLWDQAGVVPPRPAGHFRRSSIREPAEPALASTRLIADDTADGLDWSDFPEATPIVARVRSGRYDPVSQCAFLDGLVEGVTRGGACVGAEGRIAVRLGVRRAWSSCRTLPGAGDEVLETAVCTRQGCARPVMVGAPTIGLEADHIMVVEAANDARFGP